MEKTGSASGWGEDEVKRRDEKRIKEV